MIKCDFHMHSYRSSDGNMKPETIIQTCIRRGIDCVALTDHNLLEEAFELQRKAPFPVIPGEEIKTTHGEIIGLFLQEQIARGLSPGATAEEILSQGGVVYIPHPFDRLRRSVLVREALLEIVEMVDVVEVFNGRITFMADVQAAERFATQHGKLMGAGSDAHVWWELGRCYVEMPAFEPNRSSFLEALGRGRIAGKLSPPAVHLFSSLNKWRKKYLKR